ncbi:hypothetical protein CTI12_AA106840 [Artemisia annua]|uniref:Uncharacterized protein n=1 Tax=Artemisia annua TaxID=35608 RepID=A0A2U1PVV7_ARTAN|nr:hypothetical protein CTI12_AA106840 [Artemisia annua]
MGTSNLDKSNICNIHDHQSNSSSHAPEYKIQENQTSIKEDPHLVSCALKIETPTSTREFRVSNSENEPKTPTSRKHRIPVIGTCPPAPRKSRWFPTNGKRKEPYFPVVRVPADFMVYLDEMLATNEVVYVPDSAVGDLGAGDYAKRLKLLPTPANNP